MIYSIVVLLIIENENSHMLCLCRASEIIHIEEQVGSFTVSTLNYTGHNQTTDFGTFFITFGYHRATYNYSHGSISIVEI